MARKPYNKSTGRNYKRDYEKFQKSKKRKRYRAKLNKYNREKGTASNGDKKDASHKGKKIIGFKSQSVNRGMKDSTPGDKRARGGKKKRYKK